MTVADFPYRADGGLNRAAVCAVVDMRGADHIECGSNDTQDSVEACVSSGYAMRPEGASVAHLRSLPCPQVPLVLGYLILEEVRRLSTGEVLCVFDDKHTLHFYVVEGFVWGDTSRLLPVFVSVLK